MNFESYDVRIDNNTVNFILALIFTTLIDSNEIRNWY